MCVCVCIYIYIYIYIYIHSCKHKHKCLNTLYCTHIYLHICIRHRSRQEDMGKLSVNKK